MSGKAPLGKCCGPLGWIIYRFILQFGFSHLILIGFQNADGLLTITNQSPVIVPAIENLQYCNGIYLFSYLGSINLPTTLLHQIGWWILEQLRPHSLTHSPKFLYICCCYIFKRDKSSNFPTKKETQTESPTMIS